MFNKIVWKINFKNPEAVQTHEFFKMFNNWIPDSPEVFVDVADYAHVEDGPKIILVGHYLDYILDHCDRKLGFAYNRKRWANAASPNKLSSSFAEFTARAEQMANELKVSLDKSTITLIENDRAAAPNDANTFAKLKPEIDAFCKSTFGPANYDINFISNPKQRFTVQILNKSANSL